MAKQRHPFIGVGLRKWLGLLLKHGASPAYWPRALSVTCYSALLSGARVKERLQYDAQVRDCNIDRPPIFVVGHWRSGTTFLQNVLTQNPNFGYLSMVQSVFPTIFLTKEAALSKRVRARKREMDNVALSAEAPSEEEIALSALAPGSFWLGYYFPQQMDDYFQKYMLFQGITSEELAAWKDAYLYLLKKLTLRYEGRQLVLKNPPNTSRLSVLSELFPNARFIHIYRNPYRVFLSRMGQYETSVLPKVFQPLERAEWESRVLAYYQAIMKKHFEEREQIPEGYYAEVRYEDYCADPLGESERLYRELGLPAFETARPYYVQYLESIRDYRSNTYCPDRETLDKVYTHWHFTIDKWGYDAPVVA